jgi:hypothetical protein
MGDLMTTATKTDVVLESAAQAFADATANGVAP